MELGASFLYGTRPGVHGRGRPVHAHGADHRDDAEGRPAPSGPKNSARLLPYNRLDLSVTRHGRLFGAKPDYFLQVFNVYSRRNEWFVQYDAGNPVTEPEITHQLPIVPTIGVNFEF